MTWIMVLRSPTDNQCYADDCHNTSRATRPVRRITWPSVRRTSTLAGTDTAQL